MSSRLRLSLRSRGLLALALLLVVAVRPATTSAAGQDRGVFRPTFAVSETMAPFLEHLDPGSDAFRTGREAAEIQRRLDELTAAMRSRRDRIAAIGDWLLASEFRGGRLEAGDTAPSPAAEFEVHKASVYGDLVLDASTFGAELQKLMKDLREVLVAEFLITAFDVETSGAVNSEVRYDLVGTGSSAWRLEHVGRWRMRWRKEKDQWRVAEWVALSTLTGRSKQPVFTDISTPALGNNDSFTRQLSTGLDAWMATIDSVLTRDSNGHHGVSVGDADGDGLDDLYVADDTAQSLFADVGQRRRSGSGARDRHAAAPFRQ